MLGFVDVHEAVSLQEGLRHHLEFVVPGGRVPTPRTRQGAFLSLWAALAGLPTSRLGGGGLLPVHLRLEGNPAAIWHFSHERLPRCVPRTVSALDNVALQNETNSHPGLPKDLEGMRWP